MHQIKKLICYFIKLYPYFTCDLFQLGYDYLYRTNLILISFQTVTIYSQDFNHNVVVCLISLAPRFNMTYVSSPRELSYLVYKTAQEHLISFTPHATLPTYLVIFLSPMNCYQTHIITFLHINIQHKHSNKSVFIIFGFKN